MSALLYRTAMLPLGHILAGKYRVERVLGEGGFGVVVEATHLVLGERVAIKVLRPEAATQARVVARFLGEARAAARIRSEHVARVLDVGSDGPSEPPYIVMEYLHGSDLAHVMRARGALPVSTAVDHILQACLALAEAHALGIVHRDIKPANLFLATRPDGTATIKVLDFGIAKAMPTADAAPSLTRTQEVFGTPLYMAPEQMRSAKAVDARTDIWALGATLYELLAGRPAFAGATLSDIYASILTDSPAPLGSSAPPALVAVVLRCLEKRPEQRFPDVATLARALLPFGSGGVGGVAASAPYVDAAVRAKSDPHLGDTILAARHTAVLETVARGGASRRRIGAIVAAVAIAVSAAVLFVAPRARAVAPPSTISAAPLPKANVEVPPSPVAVAMEVASPSALPAATPPPPARTSGRSRLRKSSVASAAVAVAADPTPERIAPTAPPIASSAPRGVATSRFE